MCFLFYKIYYRRRHIAKVIILFYDTTALKSVDLCVHIFKKEISNEAVEVDMFSSETFSLSESEDLHW